MQFQVQTYDANLPFHHIPEALFDYDLAEVEALDSNRQHIPHFRLNKGKVLSLVCGLV